VTGIVLAGGRSQRMGVTKAGLMLGGETFLERAVSLLTGICNRVMISAAFDEPVAVPADCAVIVDDEPGQGPLGGIASCLAASGEEWHLALACDLPLVRPELLRLLAEDAATGAPADAVVPHAQGRLQPLLAAYSHRCLHPAREALAGGERAVAAMLDQVKTRVLEEDALRGADPDLASFTNVNTWEQYRALRRRWPEGSACG